MTNRPYAVNFALPPFLPDEEAFSLTLEAKPRLVTFALGEHGMYVKRVHDAGILVMRQATTVRQ